MATVVDVVGAATPNVWTSETGMGAGSRIDSWPGRPSNKAHADGFV